MGSALDEKENRAEAAKGLWWPKGVRRPNE